MSELENQSWAPASLQEYWQKQDEEKARIQKEARARRRARLGVSKANWGKLRQAVIDRDHGICQGCGTRPDNPHIDHITPLALGGSSTLDNLQVLCPQCNTHKGGRA